MSDINIVLVEPQIHYNTGNIARTCAVTGASLHLVKPLGFSVEDKHLKRAGLDYWDKLDITYYESKEDFFEKNADKEMYFFSARSKNSFYQVRYPKGVYIVFGKEDTGLDQSILDKYAAKCVRIPMRSSLRCLNLSNSVAVAAYEILRQWDYSCLV